MITINILTLINVTYLGLTQIFSGVPMKLYLTDERQMSIQD